MDWLTGQETPNRVFEDGLRWVEAIKHHEADTEAFVTWAMRSPQRFRAFALAWEIWHDVSALSEEQRDNIERVACSTARRKGAERARSK